MNDASLNERVEQALTHVEVADCWEWAGFTRAGYPSLRIEGRTESAHVWLYEQLVGPVLDGLELDHLCRNQRCVNPDHLEPVTHQENVKRGMAGWVNNAQRAKTHCVRNHEFSEANTRITPAGYRVCRTCQREDQARYQERKNQ